MSKEMKLIFENYRRGSLSESKTLLEACSFNEEELIMFNNGEVLSEGVLQFGADLWNRGVKPLMTSISNYADEKVTALLRKMRVAYEGFIKKANENFPKIMTNAQARIEKAAIRLLNTKRHVRLGILILTAIFKALGGAAIEAIADSEGTVKKLKDIMTELIKGTPAKVIKTLFGAADIMEIGEIIKLFNNFRSDMKSAALEVASSQSSSVAGTDLELAEIFKKKHWRNKMKISKEKLKQIIKEELELFELDEPVPSDDNNPEVVKSKSEFAKQFLELSKTVRGTSGLDANEMQIIMSLTVSLIKLAAGKSASPILKQINDISNKKMGTTGDVK